VATSRVLRHLLAVAVLLLTACGGIQGGGSGVIEAGDTVGDAGDAGGGMSSLMARSMDRRTF
jgi:hypothetical protein